MIKFMQLVTMVSLMIAIVIAVGLIMSYPLMILWNGCLVPAVSILHEVTWIQMWGIVILLSILFKSNINNK